MTAATPSVDEIARWLNHSKRSFLDACPPGELVQTGACELGDFVLPEVSSNGETSIETFAVSEDGDLEPLGDPAIAAQWMPAAESFIATVLDSLSEAGVEVVAPGYLTASLTPVDEVNGELHFDDEQVDDGAGVGVVAIVATHDGSRLVRTPIGCTRADHSLPLEASTAPADAHIQRCDADRIIVFPQFAQLHSGPGPLAATGMRHMFVFRAATRPQP